MFSAFKIGAQEPTSITQVFLVPSELTQFGANSVGFSDEHGRWFVIRPNVTVEEVSPHAFSAHPPRNPRPSQGLLGVLRIDGNAWLLSVSKTDEVCKLPSPEASILVIKDIDTIPIGLTASQNFGSGIFGGDNKPFSAVKSLICGGGFYFTRHARDLTLTTQQSFEPFPVPQARHFLWNVGLTCGVDPLPCVQLLHGSVNFSKIPGRSNLGKTELNVALISRISAGRAGTRFKVRGIDDNGSVATFVETEQITWTSRSKKVSSFVQVRGSIPIFWDQEATKIGRHQVKITRSPDASDAAFQKHVAQMSFRYGPVSAVSLVSKEGSENVLGSAFKAMAERNDLDFLWFDFNNECSRSRNYRGLGRVVRWVSEEAAVTADAFQRTRHGGVFLADEGGKVLKMQNGVIRTNCGDCLSRTNVFQTYLSQTILDLQMIELDLSDVALQKSVINLWQNNGDALSKFYAGTGTMKSVQDGKQNTADRSISAVEDGLKVVRRAIVGKFKGESRHKAVVELLHQSEEEEDETDDSTKAHIRSVLFSRRHEFSTKEVMKIFAVTWNVAGSTVDKAKSVDRMNTSLEWPGLAWPSPYMPGAYAADVIVVALQEVVDFDVGSVMLGADGDKVTEWCHEFLKMINGPLKEANVEECNHFIPITSPMQLVGVGLIVFARRTVASKITHVNVDKEAVGVQMIGKRAGNKGACAISFNLNSTSICVISSHLAAGQKAVVKRNEDYTDITNGLSFPHAPRTLNEHDLVIWCGDLNYRINNDNSSTRGLIAKGALPALIEFDQLTVEKRDGRCFQGYQEFPLDFAPTYKYDKNSTEYDTSEKQRVPSWTDRILFKDIYGMDGICKQIGYDRAEVLSSDHRPVRASFEVETMIIDQAAKTKLEADVRQRVAPMHQDAQALNQWSDLIDTSELVDVDAPKPSHNKVRSDLFGLDLSSPLGSHDIEEPKLDAHGQTSGTEVSSVLLPSDQSGHSVAAAFMSQPQQSSEPPPLFASAALVEQPTPPPLFPASKKETKEVCSELPAANFSRSDSKYSAFEGMFVSSPSRDPRDRYGDADMFE